ncbi:hypothetical protein HK101_008143 [Irineochytrium annulatum]|nr:hypothetical protein HK101_008143 [Irineochytrium annulatum]
MALRLSPGNVSIKFNPPGAGGVKHQIVVRHPEGSQGAMEAVRKAEDARRERESKGRKGSSTSNTGQPPALPQKGDQVEVFEFSAQAQQVRGGPPPAEIYKYDPKAASPENGKGVKGKGGSSVKRRTSPGTGTLEFEGKALNALVVKPKMSSTSKEKLHSAVVQGARKKESHGAVMLDAKGLQEAANPPRHKLSNSNKLFKAVTTKAAAAAVAGNPGAETPTLAAIRANAQQGKQKPKQPVDPNLRKKLIHLIAPKPISMPEIVNRMGKSMESYIKEIILKVAKLQTDEVHYVLRQQTYLELKPYEWAPYCQKDKDIVCSNARIAFGQLKLDPSRPEWRNIEPLSLMPGQSSSIGRKGQKPTGMASNAETPGSSASSTTSSSAPMGAKRKRGSATVEEVEEEGAVVAEKGKKATGRAAANAAKPLTAAQKRKAAAKAAKDAKDAEKAAAKAEGKEPPAKKARTSKKAKEAESAASPMPIRNHSKATSASASAAAAANHGLPAALVGATTSRRGKAPVVVAAASRGVEMEDGEEVEDGAIPSPSSTTSASGLTAEREKERERERERERLEPPLPPIKLRLKSSASSPAPVPAVPVVPVAHAGKSPALSKKTKMDEKQTEQHSPNSDSSRSSSNSSAASSSRPLAQAAGKAATRASEASKSLKPPTPAPASVSRSASPALVKRSKKEEKKEKEDALAGARRSGDLTTKTSTATKGASDRAEKLEKVDRADAKRSKAGSASTSPDKPSAPVEQKGGSGKSSPKRKDREGFAVPGAPAESVGAPVSKKLKSSPSKSGKEERDDGASSKENKDFAAPSAPGNSTSPKRKDREAVDALMTESSAKKARPDAVGGRTPMPGQERSAKNPVAAVLADGVAGRNRAASGGNGNGNGNAPNTPALGQGQRAGSQQQQQQGNGQSMQGVVFGGIGGGSGGGRKGSGGSNGSNASLDSPTSIKSDLMDLDDPRACYDRLRSAYGAACEEIKGMNAAIAAITSRFAKEKLPAAQDEIERFCRQELVPRGVWACGEDGFENGGQFTVKCLQLTLVKLVRNRNLVILEADRLLKKFEEMMGPDGLLTKRIRERGGVVEAR